METVLVNIGNSRIVAARWPESADDLVPDPDWLAADRTPPRVRRLFSIATPHNDVELDDLESACRGLVAEYGATQLVLSSVVPRLDGYFTADFNHLRKIDSTTDFPFAVAVDEPGAVGADRYCNLAAASAAGWETALVVDAGTATTFDLLLDSVFAGGLIAPGMAFAAEKLGETAARLAPAHFTESPVAVGTNTTMAMQGGAYHVGCNGVIGTIEALLTRYGAMPVVITGGLGRFLVRSGWLHDPDWTLRGMAVLG